MEEERATISHHHGVAVALLVEDAKPRREKSVEAVVKTLESFSHALNVSEK